MDLRLTVDELRLHGATEDTISAVLKAATGAVADATRRLERDLEGQTRLAAKGNAWRAWKSRTYPRGGGGSYNPTGEVFANGGARSKGMLSYWSLAGTNRAKRSEYLAVPLRAALGSYSGRDIDPASWERRFGAKLRPWFRPGKTPLLVADGYFGPTGFVPVEKGAAMARGGQRVRRSSAIPVFALIDEQPHANRVSIGAAVSRAENYMGASFHRRMARSL